jgi:indole-3-acetate monooxygenase
LIVATVLPIRQPDLDELIARARAIAPLLEEEATASEKQGKLTDRSVKALKDGGFWDLLGPAEFGGLDLGPFDAMQVVEEIFRADGSAGWIVMAQNVQLKPLPIYSREVVTKMYEGGAPGIGGQGAPVGTAVKVEGGYRVTGKWSYGSNVLHSDYVSGSCLLVEDGVPAKGAFGAPSIVRWLAPFDQVQIDGNWDVLGLEATGSVDYSVSDLFVPDDFVIIGLFNSKAADWVQNPSSLSVVLWIFWGHVVGELGLGRRLMEELKALAYKGSVNRGRLVDDPVFMTDYAKAFAAFEAARTWNYQIWQDIQAGGERGEPTTRELITLARTAMLHIQSVNAANAQFAFREAGGSGLRDGPLQRLYRNIMTAGQHMVMSRKIWSECGKDLIGNAEGMMWGPYALMPIPGQAKTES